MKLLIITSAYSKYLEAFYARRPDLSASGYLEQKESYRLDAFGWASSWTEPLSRHGWQVQEMVWNVAPMQRAWARERGRKDHAQLGLKEISLLQAKEFQPDIVWFDDYDEVFLRALRKEVPSIKGVLGWVGSAIPRTDVWRHLDLVLSCAPESVALLKKEGVPALHFPHSFDPTVLERVEKRRKSVDLSFVGQLVRFSDYHLKRDSLLEQLAGQVALEIYSPSSCTSRREDLRSQIKVTLCHGMGVLRRLGVPESRLRRLPVLGIVAGLEPEQCWSVNPRLRRFLKPPVFGMEMFQLVADSLLTLNIHADSSPDFASNMRLYEVTGVGSCLVSDWKKNLHEIFEPDREVVAFKSPEECVEKVKWLLEHPDQAAAIAAAGQRRTLDNYTFAHRAGALAEQFGKLLSGRCGSIATRRCSGGMDAA